MRIIFSKKLFMTCLLCSFLFVANAQQSTYQNEKNIIYTKHEDSYSKERCKLDLYYPVDKKDFITVIWFHGGGLTGGNKELPSYLKEKDIAVVGVGYRLAPNVKVQDIINDAADAVKWTFNNVERFGGSKQKIVISGMSAGAYLSLMLALNTEYLSKRGLSPDDLYGVVSFSAQTITHFTARKEQGIEGLQPTIDKLAPLYWVRNNVPRMLLLTGDRELEMMGRYEENAYLERMLKLHGNTNVSLYELDGYGHNMEYPAFPLFINVLKEWSKKQ